MTAIDGGLAAEFRSHFPDFHWQRIETGGTGRGIPDSNYCFGGVEGWLELKATAGWAVGLRPEQIGWISRRLRAGGRCWVAVRQRAPAGPRRAPRDSLWLVWGGLVKVLAADGLRAVQGAQGAYAWHGHGPARWDWVMVRELLLGVRGP